MEMAPLNDRFGHSIAHDNRRQLESLGDYVARANVDWFAVFPEKLAELEGVAAANDRASNLVVYRTKSNDNRDHHVIPMSELAGLLTERALTHSEVNGTVRWNITLKNHIVKVSHSDLSVNVKRFFRAPLAIELHSRGEGFFIPIDLEPPARILTTTYRILRDTEVAQKLKADHDYRCQICDTTIELPDGRRYAEGHHIRPLGRPHDGPDIRENMVVLCPNHHAMCDYRAIRLTVDVLRRIEGHIIDPLYIAYHNDRLYRNAGDT
jgi:hypothetical protein